MIMVISAALTEADGQDTMKEKLVTGRMTDMIQEFCAELHFPQEAIPALSEAYDKLLADPAVVGLLEAAEESLFTPGSEVFLEYLQQVADRSGVNRYTVDMVFLLTSLKPLRQKYRQQNLPEPLLWQTMEDLRYKLVECRDVYGIWGTFVTGWFKGFYLLERFKLGRLEYEKVPFRLEAYRDWKKGQTVVNCHIPSSGPLNRQEVLDSLKQAHSFYRDTLRDGVMLVTCHSWLLYPPHYQVFPEGGNMRKFYELFDVVESEVQEDNENFWRVFNREYAPEILDQVPADTTLRRRFLEYLRTGRIMGNGFGILLFDGEKVL